LRNQHFHLQSTLHQHDYRSHHQPIATIPISTRTHIEIGADYRATEKMEGVEDHSIKPPMIVVDGANVAFAYGEATSTASLSTAAATNRKPVPDVRGLRVVDQFFGHHCHVRFVLTQSWLRKQYEDAEQLNILQELQTAGKLITAPVSDDDDAYALQIAQRENALRRRSRQQQHGLAYVLSNDHFRDAQQRHGTDSALTHWLNVGYDAETGCGRISFAFGDLGRLDDHGDRVLDIMPNPRHPLIVWIERQQHQQHDRHSL